VLCASLKGQQYEQVDEFQSALDSALAHFVFLSREVSQKRPSNNGYSLHLKSLN